MDIRESLDRIEHLGLRDNPEHPAAFPQYGRPFAFSSFENKLPRDGLSIAYELDIRDVVPNLNPLILYRSLKMNFGKPDQLTRIDESLEESSHYGYDWGYVFRYRRNILMQILSKEFNSKFILRNFMNKEDSVRYTPHFFEHQSHKFLHELQKYMNSVPFDEAKLLNDSQITHKASTFNALSYYGIAKYAMWWLADVIYHREDLRDKFFSDDELPFPISELMDQDYEGARMEKIVQFFVAPLRIASELYTLISLEAFVDTIYEFLLKEEFQNRRFMNKLDRNFSKKVLHMHQYCRGFRHPPVEYGSELWAEIKDLRNFRNELMHAKRSPKNDIYIVDEDKNKFSYYPGYQSRGIGQHRGQSKYPGPMFICTRLGQTGEVYAKFESAIRDALEDDVLEEINDFLLLRNSPYFDFE